MVRFILHVIGIFLTSISVLLDCDDNPKQKSHIDGICNIATLFEAFNFDMLKAMVEELNRYGETPAEVLKFLNARPEFIGHRIYQARLTVQGTCIFLEYCGQPLMGALHLTHWDRSGDGKRTKVTFTANDLEDLNPAEGKFVFSNPENFLASGAD
jgi:hypothetical protein